MKQSLSDYSTEDNILADIIIAKTRHKLGYINSHSLKQRLKNLNEQLIGAENKQQDAVKVLENLIKSGAILPRKV